MDSIGMSCIKYLLFLFNLLFAISGIVVLAIGIMIQQMYHSYSVFIDDKFFSAPGIFIVVGVFIFVIAFFGCCGAINESNYMLITFAVLLCLIFISEIAGGIASYIMKDDIYRMLETRMNSSLKSYKMDVYNTKTWDALQFDLSCCGVKSYNDWSSVISNGSLPHSCCIYLALHEPCIPDRASKEGCLLSLQTIFEHNTSWIVYFGIAIAVVQVIYFYAVEHLISKNTMIMPLLKYICSTNLKIEINFSLSGF
ncbi:hypothetical protein AAG570_000412 [Ranatra chinensis]|uniref:Tetraspanin n=1 Tax=Ranatra chinensis TaxID=642074 RepID=A0ABD0YWZ5_9HEMI